MWVFFQDSWPFIFSKGHFWIVDEVGVNISNPEVSNGQI